MGGISATHIELNEIRELPPMLIKIRCSRLLRHPQKPEAGGVRMARSALYASDEKENKTRVAAEGVCVSSWRLQISRSKSSNRLRQWSDAMA